MRSMAMASGEHVAVEMVEVREGEPWDACRIAHRCTPSPGPYQALIRILCRPINPSDVLCLQGLYLAWRPKEYPSVPGLEGMGVVQQIGENVSNVSVGQRVIPMSQKPDQTGQGLWQEFIVVPAMQLIPIPDFISDEVAAQFIVNPWSVIGLFRTLAVPKGEYVLQTASASVLGRMFIQYVHHEGVKTINLVRRSDQLAELKALGADEVINTNDGDVVEKVKKITGGRMAFGAIDCVGGELTKVVVESVRDGGTVLVYGLLAAPHVEAGILDLIFKGVKVEGFYMSRWVSGFTADDFQELIGLTINLLANKIIDPCIGQKYKLHDFKDAIRRSLEPLHGGKVLLVSD